MNEREGGEPGEAGDRDEHEQPESEGEQSPVFPTGRGWWFGMAIPGVEQNVIEWGFKALDGFTPLAQATEWRKREREKKENGERRRSRWEKETFAHSCRSPSHPLL